MATLTRIYRVTIGANDRLVRATHPSAALMYVARDIASVTVATQDDLVDCLSDGIEVESAKEDAAPAPVQFSLSDPLPAEDKSLPLWPMPTERVPPGYTPPLPEPEVIEGVDDDDDDDDDDEPEPMPMPVSKRNAALAKYRCPMTHQTWAGRGLQPQWLKVALAGGAKLDDFVVKATLETIPQE